MPKNWFPKTITLSEEWIALDKKLDGFPNEPYEYQDNLNITWSEGFVILINNHENNKLINSYRLTRKKIANYYKNRNFLETTLKLWQKQEKISHFFYQI